ncbi:unnamed protein product [Caenorhabditis sp. 36 PRJEB53466]|nr:unnamed protein product [Caenorhabditis sp. 36 PRJEB53466]
MSAPSKSQNLSKRSSVVFPPTARSPSLTTATAITDPAQIPTALGNSVKTAIGATPSDFETNSGLADTSAGSSRAILNGSEQRTGKSLTSPEKIMNDLKRGNVFGRSSTSQSQATGGPQSVTRITFSINTDISTASEASLKETNSKVSVKTTGSTSISTGKEATRSKRTNRRKGRRTSTFSAASRKKLTMPEVKDSSGKSAKSKKSKKSKKAVKKVVVESSETSTKSESAPRKRRLSKNEEKSMKKVVTPKFEKSDESKKEKAQKLGACFPGVTGRTSASRKSPSKAPVYPGVAPNMSSVAPPPLLPTSDDSFCVYDVAELGPAQRRVPPPPAVGKTPPPPLFTNQKISSMPRMPPKCKIGTVPKAKSDGVGNKMIVFGATPDGKTTVQITIDLQIVAGAALGESTEPVALVPKKVIVKGKTFAVDGSDSNSVYL